MSFSIQISSQFDIDLLAARVIDATENNTIPSLKAELEKRNHADEKAALKNIYPDLYQLLFPIETKNKSAQPSTRVPIEEEKKHSYELGEIFLAKIISFTLQPKLQTLTEKISQTNYRTADEALSHLQELYEESKKTLGNTHDLTKLIGERMSFIGFEN